MVSCQKGFFFIDCEFRKIYCWGIAKLVRHQILILTLGGSSPPTPSNFPSKNLDLKILSKVAVAA